MNSGDRLVRASGLVLVAHPEFGMGVELLRGTSEQAEQAERMIKTLQANEGKHLELSVTPDGMERAENREVGRAASATGVVAAEDPLVDMFRQSYQVPVETFLQQMREQRQALDSR
jgi:hypothetical protein